MDGGLLHGFKCTVWHWRVNGLAGHFPATFMRTFMHSTMVMNRLLRRLALIAACSTGSFARGDALDFLQAEPTPPQSAVTLSNGEVLQGELLRQDADGVVLKHPVLGDIALRPDQYTEVESIEPAAPKSPWASFVNASVSGVQSTNDTLDLRLAGGTAYEADGLRFQFDAQWYYRSNDGTAQDNNVLATELLEQAIGESPWTIFEKAQFEYDEFQSWKQRYSIFGGAGYKVCTGEPLELTPRVGFGATREEGTSDRWYPSMLVGFDGLWTISQDQRVKIGGEYVPDVANFQEFYFVNVFADFEWDLPDLEHVALVAGIREEYNSSSTDGTAKNELRYYIGLQFGF